MKSLSVLSLAGFCCLLPLAIGCSPESVEQGTASPPVSPAEGATPVSSGLAELVPYGREPWPGIITAGQPSKEDFQALYDGGIRTVINLRVPTERTTRDQPAWMEEIGFEYISIPVAGAAGLSEDVARSLDQALANSQRPVLVHCGSSNRVGAAFALRAFHLEDESPEAALQIGISAGLTKLEGHVREMLQDN